MQFLKRHEKAIAIAVSVASVISVYVNFGVRGIAVIVIGVCIRQQFLIFK